ncbi:hypothetical protein RND71_021225 [Anisodus tanguticus]|uniref:Dihydrolipoamide acetyltransferase component of pyruvate dehydrogenase complex n=1 Tax=Anisodus tanguticus TaxID=243964 RepID=A0AAE1RW50_9SOLA|nr:hypothetical protein RND71_021225 [Anisodus tanguticus]
MSHLLQSTFIPTTPTTLHRSSIFPTTHLRKTHVVESKIREIFMPALSSTMTEGKIISWVKTEGDRLAKGESVVVVESDKADMDVESFYDGYLATIIVLEGSSAPIGSPIALLAESEDEISLAKLTPTTTTTSSSSQETTPAAAAVTEEASVTSIAAAAAVSSSGPVKMASSIHPASEGGKRVVASPYAKKLAKDLGLDLRGLVGSGPNGRIVAKDVEAVADSSASIGVAPAPHCGEAKWWGPSGSSNRIGDECAIHDNAECTTALALAKHPVVNSSCRDGKSFTYNSSINIAVAVAIDGGLITPVLQDADKVDLYSLSRKWKELVDKARAKQLQPHEYTTGTFTLSNLGMFGVDRFDAILPPGTGAIMAVGASQPALVGSKDGRIGMKNQMQVNVTADHRVIYGADLASFLQTLAQIIEDPKDLTL